ncbi:10842_t:CDS:1, partial [Cetraspora pellucida]
MALTGVTTSDLIDSFFSTATNTNSVSNQPPILTTLDNSNP